MSAGQWITLKADSYEAQVSAAKFLAYPGSLLANLVELELANPSGPTPCIRLDCCEAVGREIVSLLRYMGSYTPPTDAKLLRALQYQLDFYGVAMPSDHRGQEIVLVPACVVEDVDECGPIGMLAYSSRTRGWANIFGQADTRPSQLRNNNVSCVASVLRAETTSAGEDLGFIVSNDEANNSTAFMINSSFKCKPISAPQKHSCAYGSAMAAARGNLYLLGGFEHHQWEGPSIGIPFEVYDPHLNTWHQATPPPHISGHTASLVEHALVATQPEGMLIAVGGWWHGQSSNDIRDHVLGYDITGGKWSINPSGCTYLGASGIRDARAVSIDPYTLMVLGPSLDARTARVDLLDMRTWRWRSGASLTGGYTHGIGLVMYDNQVLAIGGRDRASDTYAPPDSTSTVRAYDVRSDQWSEMPHLPQPGPDMMGICEACPVVMRAASVLQP